MVKRPIRPAEASLGAADELMIAVSWTAKSNPRLSCGLAILKYKVGLWSIASTVASSNSSVAISVMATGCSKVSGAEQHSGILLGEYNA
ncbi:hypothetical protein VTO42DRAFT_5053 [Malbranchea cinnamomea]